MSRPMSEPEIYGFRLRYGYPPLALPVAQDALVVMVNQANPLQSISQRQLDAIFSVTRQCGQAAPIRNWGALGLPGEWRSLALLRIWPQYRFRHPRLFSPPGAVRWGYAAHGQRAARFGGGGAGGGRLGECDRLYQHGVSRQWGKMAGD